MTALEIIGIVCAGLIAVLLAEQVVASIRQAAHGRKLAAEKRVRQIVREEIAEHEEWLAICRKAQADGGE